MNHDELGNEEFESYRRQRNVRRNKQQTRESVSRSNAVRAIHEEEQRDTLERQLQREMMDFVDATTKIAARILGEVNENQADALQQKIADEMREFFNSTLSRAELLVEILREKYSDAANPQQEVETHLRSLGSEALDEFRVLGSEEGNLRHLGSTPEEAMSNEEAAGEEEPVADVQPPEEYAEAQYADVVPCSGEEANRFIRPRRLSNTAVQLHVRGADGLEARNR